MDDALTRLRELATLKVSQRLAHTLLRLTAPAKLAGSSRLAVPHSLDPPGARGTDRHHAVHRQPYPHRLGSGPVLFDRRGPGSKMLDAEGLRDAAEQGQG